MPVIIMQDYTVDGLNKWNTPYFQLNKIKAYFKPYFKHIHSNKLHVSVATCLVNNHEGHSGFQVKFIHSHTFILLFFSINSNESCLAWVLFSLCAVEGQRLRSRPFNIIPLFLHKPVQFSFHSLRYLASHWFCESKSLCLQFFLAFFNDYKWSGKHSRFKYLMRQLGKRSFTSFCVV